MRTPVVGGTGTTGSFIVEEHSFAWRRVRTERAVVAAHPGAALFRYTCVYGPHQVVPRV